MPIKPLLMEIIMKINLIILIREIHFIIHLLLLVVVVELVILIHILILIMEEKLLIHIIVLQEIIVNINKNTKDLIIDKTLDNNIDLIKQKINLKKNQFLILLIHTY